MCTSCMLWSIHTCSTQAKSNGHSAVYTISYELMQLLGSCKTANRGQVCLTPSLTEMVHNVILFMFPPQQPLNAVVFLLSGHMGTTTNWPLQSITPSVPYCMAFTWSLAWIYTQGMWMSNHADAYAWQGSDKRTPCHWFHRPSLYIWTYCCRIGDR